jgi:hypothetical protein
MSVFAFIVSDLSPSYVFTYGKCGTIFRTPQEMFEKRVRGAPQRSEQCVDKGERIQVDPVESLWQMNNHCGSHFHHHRGTPQVIIVAEWRKKPAKAGVLNPAHWPDALVLRLRIVAFLRHGTIVKTKHTMFCLAGCQYIYVLVSKHRARNYGDHT